MSHQVVALWDCVCASCTAGAVRDSLCLDAFIRMKLKCAACRCLEGQFVSHVLLSQPCNAIGLRLLGLYLYPPFKKKKEIKMNERKHKEEEEKRERTC